MINPVVGEGENQKMKEEYEETKKKILTTFAGFNYEFAEGLAVEKTEAERRDMYKKLFNTGELRGISRIRWVCGER